MSLAELLLEILIVASARSVESQDFVSSDTRPRLLNEPASVGSPRYYHPYNVPALLRSGKPIANALTLSGYKHLRQHSLCHVSQHLLARPLNLTQKLV